MSDFLELRLGTTTQFVRVVQGESAVQWLRLANGDFLELTQSVPVVTGEDIPTPTPTEAPTVSAVGEFSGRDLTVTATATGEPTPTLAITLTSGGSEVTPSGSNPWTYSVPSSDAETVVTWTVRANNSAGNAQTFGALTLASDLVFPAVETSAEVDGREVTVTAVASGTPTPTLTIEMTNNGTDVTPTGTNPWVYTAPSSFDFSFIAWNVTATNTAGAAVSEDNSVSIAPDQVPSPPDPPVLTGTLSIVDTADPGTGSISMDKPSQVYWGLYASDSLSTDAQTAGPIIAAGTGALDYGSLDVTGSVALNISFASGISVGAGTFYIVARDLSEDPNFSDWSNVLKDTSVNVVTEGWSVSVGNATATIDSYPAVPTSPSWSITVGNTTATINSYPGQ